MYVQLSDKDLLISWIELITGDHFIEKKSDDTAIENIYISTVSDHGEEII